MSDFFESLGKESLHAAEDDTAGFGPHIPDSNIVNTWFTL